MRSNSIFHNQVHIMISFKIYIITIEFMRPYQDLRSYKITEPKVSPTQNSFANSDWLWVSQSEVTQTQNSFANIGAEQFSPSEQFVFAEPRRELFTGQHSNSSISTPIFTISYSLKRLLYIIQYTVAWQWPFIKGRQPGRQILLSPWRLYI